MEYSEGLMTELRTLEDFEKSLSLTKVGERRIKALRKCRDDFKKLHLPHVRLSFSDEKFRELFNELINAGRDMQTRDNLGNSYMSEDMYFKDVKARYSNEA